MFDLLIKNGLVVTEHDAHVADVAIAHGKIVAVAAPMSLNQIPCALTIDARDKIVLPGGIDPHIHCNFVARRDPHTGAPIVSEGPRHVSRAALFGGTTTLIDFAIWHGQDSLQHALTQRDEDWRGQSYCDYAFHIMLTGKIPTKTLGELAEAMQAGYPTVKIFTTNVRPGTNDRKIEYGDIWEILQVTAKQGGLAAIHAEDDDLVMHMYAKLIREGRVGFEHMAEVHTALSEDLSFRRIMRLAESVEGAALYMMHVSAASGIAAIKEARARGLPVYGETLHQYMLYTSADYRRPNGQIYHTYPSLKSEQDRLALWQGAEEGEISTVATDGICTPLVVKVQGSRIDDVTGGSAGVEPRLSVMYSEMVVKRGYALPKFASLVSTNAARIMGLYPRKGVIAAGSDADIVVFDPTVKRRISVEHLHEANYTPWEGYEIAGWPEITIVRGQVAVDRGEFVARSHGVALTRKIPESIRSKAIC